jgi:hypothetical protein
MIKIKPVSNVCRVGHPGEWLHNESVPSMGRARGEERKALTLLTSIQTPPIFICSFVPLVHQRGRRSDDFDTSDPINRGK